MGEMAEAEAREGLLKKKNNVDYYDNCPGCKIDRLKETTPGPPFKLLLYVFVVVLAAGGGGGGGGGGAAGVRRPPLLFIYFFYVWFLYFGFVFLIMKDWSKINLFTIFF
jgi:hypothetical protein